MRGWVVYVTEVCIGFGEKGRGGVINSDAENVEVCIEACPKRIYSYKSILKKWVS